MKLKDLLKNIFANGPLPQHNLNSEPDYILDREYILMFKDMIHECDEFRDVTEIIVPEHQVFLMGNHNTATSVSLKLCDGIRFVNRCYLTSISLTPALYDPNRKHSYVKNNALITPTMYDVETFTPYREMRIRWSPELAQDVSIPQGEIDLRQRLHDILDDMLDNINEYQIKPIRGVIVRGVFEYEVPEEEKTYYLEL